MLDMKHAARLVLASLPLILGTLTGACAKASAADNSPSPPTAATATPAKVGTDPGHAGQGTPLTPTGHNRLAAFAAGCFWGTEDAFRHVPGVVATAVGYAGGHTQNPTYPAVCTHTTGHAETVLVEFDPSKVPYEQLLRDFWKIHDPTQVGGQGPDEGDSYRSVIFTFDDDEAAAAKASMKAAQKSFTAPITTTIQPIGPFWKAEDYHQQYAERTGHHGCPVRLPLDTQM
jgi:peptide-methionine (S)-S-oxide reductase